MTYLLRALDAQGHQLGVTLEFNAESEAAALDRYADSCTIAARLGGTVELLKGGKRLAIFEAREARFSAAPDGTTEDKKP